MKPRLVLFDIDHTLLDVLAFHEPAYTTALNDVYGVVCRLRDIEFSGKTTPNIIRELARRHGITDDRIEADLPRALEALARDITANLDSDLQESILPGVLDVLESLRSDGITLGIVTGNPRMIGEEVLRRSKLLPYFAVRAFGDEAAERWQLVALAIERGQHLLMEPLTPQQVVVVGDSPHDVRAGRRVGAATVAIGTGLHHDDQLAASHPDIILSDLSDHRAATKAIITANGKRPPIGDGPINGQEALASDADTPA